MKKVLLASVAILAFAAPAFAAEPTATGGQAPAATTTGQAPPASTARFYVAQDAGMKCQVTNVAPTGTSKALGTTYPTEAAAQTALSAEKTCAH